MEERSRQIRANSALGILTVAAYSVSGMPRCSESMSISFSSKSEILSWSVGWGGHGKEVSWKVGRLHRPNGGKRKKNE